MLGTVHFRKNFVSEGALQTHFRCSCENAMMSFTARCAAEPDVLNVSGWKPGLRAPRIPWRSPSAISSGWPEFFGAVPVECSACALFPRAGPFITLRVSREAGNCRNFISQKKKDNKFLPFHVLEEVTIWHRNCNFLFSSIRLYFSFRFDSFLGNGA